MARVLIATQPWGLLYDGTFSTPEYAAGQSVTLKTPAGVAVTAYTTATGSTPATLTSSGVGVLPGWVEAGTYDLTWSGTTTRVEAVGGPLSPSGDVTGAADAAVLAAAVSALPASGGTVEFGRGDLYVNSWPSFASTTNVTIKGQGGRSGGAQPATRINYTGTAAVNCQSSVGFRLVDIAVTYASASLAGKLFDLSHATASDAAFCSFERCTITGTGGTATGATSLISLANAHDIQVRDCLFGYAVCAIRGKDIAGDYSNRVLVEGCEFGNCSQAPVQSTGQAWKVDSCTFEQLSTGAAGAYLQTVGQANGLTFDGCWFGDANALGRWLVFSGVGLVVTGCYLTSGLIAIDLAASTFGVLITGNHFEGSGSNALATGVNVAANCTDLVIVGNSFKKSSATIVTTPIGLADNPIASLLQNVSGGNIEVRGSQVSVASAATVTLSGGASVYAVTGTTGITSITASWVGRVVTLVFAGALTVTDGSNLKLAGNLSTGTNTTLTLCCDGTNWIEMARAVN